MRTSCVRMTIGTALVLVLTGCPSWFRPAEQDYAAQYAGQNPVALINATSLPICVVYLWPAGATSFGTDWLGETEIVQPGMRRDFGVVPGTYGFRLEGCDGSMLQYQPTADLLGAREIFLSDGTVPVYAPAAGYQRLEYGLMRTPPPPYGSTSSGGSYGSTSSGGYGSTSSGGYGSTSSGGSYGSTSSGPPTNYYSLTLHNSCPETLDLFIGDGTPPFGSGTYTNIGSNTTQSESGTLPETFWIVDESRNPISSFSPSAGSSSIQILSSCSGFAPY